MNVQDLNDRCSGEKSPPWLDASGAEPALVMGYAEIRSFHFVSLRKVYKACQSPQVRSSISSSDSHSQIK